MYLKKEQEKLRYKFIIFILSTITSKMKLKVGNRNTNIVYSVILSQFEKNLPDDGGTQNLGWDSAERKHLNKIQPQQM